MPDETKPEEETPTASLPDSSKCDKPALWRFFEKVETMLGSEKKPVQEHLKSCRDCRLYLRHIVREHGEYWCPNEDTLYHGPEDDE